ncbi:MAG TPA: TonB-dependent receptor [Bryobacteraceae bacterium]|nr:TonB-dependent receptor [Bryobacteraceae bacterium]
MNTFTRLCRIFCAFAGLAVALVFAQAPTGEIAGTVYDESGAVVPNATVLVTNKATGAERTLTSGLNGSFSTTSLLAGSYDVKVELTGFRTLVRQATVETGSVTTVDMHLQLGATKDVVTVEGASPLVEYDRHTIDGVVNRQQIQNLPLNGRSFLQLAFLEPGVTVSAGSQGQYNRAFDVSVLGGDSNLTRITVDGASVRDSVTGGTQQNFSQEVVQEFQVSAVNFDLSTSIAAGGAINVVTRTGGNDFHGSGFFFFRDHNMSAYPALQRDPNDPDPFFARRQTGVWLGGPVKKDKLFFFANYEHNNQRGVFDSLPNTPDFRNFAVITPSPFNGNLVGGRLDYHLSQKHSAFLRYSHDGNDSFAPRDASSLPSAWVSNVNWADSGVASLISSFTPSLVNEFRYSMTFWSNKNSLPTAEQCPGCLGLGGPNIAVEGTGLSFGNQTNTPQSRVLRRHIFADNMTWQHGSHHMKFGGEIEYQKGTGTYTIDEPAAITLYSPDEVRQLAPKLVPLLPKSFNTLTDILKLPLKSFSFSFGDVRQPPPFQIGNADHDYNLHYYWEDSWKVKSNLTINYGLGWTYETNALNHDMSKPAWFTPILGANGIGPEYHAPLHFSPMFGFAYSPHKSTKTVIRGGAGMYYDTIDIELRLVERNYLGPLGAGYVTLPGSIVPNQVPGIPGVKIGQPLDFTSTGPTAFSGAILAAILPTIRSMAMGIVPVNPNNTDLSVTTAGLFKTATEIFARDFVPPSAEHFSLGIQRQISNDFAISADFVYRHFLHLTERDQDLNLFNRFVNGVQTPVIPICSSAQQLVPNAPCSNGSVEVITSGGRSVYKGLLVKLDKRFSHRYQLQASYALQGQDGINGIYNLQNYYKYWGPQGPRSILNVSGMVDLPWKFQASFISTYSSRTPFQPIIPGVDLTGSGLEGFPLPGMSNELFNRGLTRSDLVNLVSVYNSTYAGKKGPNPNQVFPRITLPQNYDFGRNFNSQDIRVTKLFRWKERYEWQLFGEGFNIFNIANLGGFSNNLLDASFGQPSSRAGNIFGTGGPRAFQVGSRFSW